MTPCVARTRANLVSALRQHVDLLDEYSRHAFREGNQAFFGEVAGKLRVLVYNSRTNKPLLLGLMKDFDTTIPIPIDRPGGDIEITIDEFLDSRAFAIAIPSRGLVSVSNRQLIAMWAEQYGASHEDVEVEEEFTAILSSGIFIAGLPGAAAALRAISDTVLWLSREFLTLIEREGPIPNT
jgi:hypothetical protein